jgi:bidirectional [NiFe] hydrogenase diaphorase subunit
MLLTPVASVTCGRSGRDLGGPLAPKHGPPVLAHPSGDKRFKLLDVAIKRHQNRPDALIELLHAAQELFGYLDDDVLIYVGRSLGVPLSRVYGVATFYNFFSLKPHGEHTCVVCLGTACYVKGSGAILNALQAAEGIRAGETTQDGKLSLVTARCIGACGLAPAVVFDGETVGKVTADNALERAARWKTDEQRSA